MLVGRITKQKNMRRYRDILFSQTTHVTSQVCLATVIFRAMRVTSIAVLTLVTIITRCEAQEAKTSADDLNHFTFDASQPVEAPENGYLYLGGRSTNGHELVINNRYLLLDGKPWLPVMGEFHFSRYPESAWETEILKMKAGGVRIVATYIFWVHHEEIEGQFDWSGQRDLRRFVQLCAKHGMYVYLRIGPWNHGEVRNGGFPDWLATKTKLLRQNDPVYLRYVDRFYGEIGKQLQGELWGDGGPVVGVQLENEYGETGPEAGAAHIAKLKELALHNGIQVPLYSVTGWPNQDFPPREVVPMLGGYPDGFWDGSLKDQPPSYVYMFNYRRATGDMGAIAGTAVMGNINMQHYPYFEAEAGGGMETSYHRRPLIDADDVADLSLIGIGSGVNLYGYYMFHGGANPAGKLTTLQESQATGYPNDLPVRSYDFQAPLGEFGQMRESFRKLKKMHLFLNAFGADLAPMVVLPPNKIPENAADASVPRLSVRAKDGRGFLFVSNYSRKLEMPERHGFQVSIRTRDGVIMMPQQPVAVPPNAYFIWPFNLAIGTATLRCSTAQLVTKLEERGQTTYVFFAVPGITPEFLFDAKDTEDVRSMHGSVKNIGGKIYVRDLKPGRDAIFDVIDRDRRSNRVLLLTEGEAEELWKVNLHGKEHLLLSRANIYNDGEQLDMRSTDREAMRFSIYSTADVTSLGKDDRHLVAKQDGIWKLYSLEFSAAPIQYAWKKVHDAGPTFPMKIGTRFSWRQQGVAEAPQDGAFNDAAQWELNMPSQSLAGISELYLRLDYVGDVGRAYVADELIDDNFYNGAEWEIGLRRFLPRGAAMLVQVRVLPLKGDSPIYLDQRAWARIPRDQAIAHIESATVVPEYEAAFTFESKQ